MDRDVHYRSDEAMTSVKSWITTCAVFLAFITAPTALYAHEGEALEPHDLWSAWEFDPVVVALLLISATLYVRGVRQLWQNGPRGIRRWNITCYAVGWSSLVIALVSPLHSMGSVLFSAHMAQHEVLMVIAAPLLVLGKPLVPYLWGLPIGLRRLVTHLVRRKVWRKAWTEISSAPVACLLHGIALWIWHTPLLYQATITNEWVHSLQHFSFLGSALLFAWSLLQSHSGRRRYGVAVFYTFITAVHTSLLGALLTFAPRPWYTVYTGTTMAWGYTPLEDQQLGGLIMWVPAGIIYTLAGLAFFALWINPVSVDHPNKESAYAKA
jgi:putative membrane protein